MTMTTSWRIWILSALCLVGLASSAFAQDEKPRVIVLAFDGVDHATTEKFIAEALNCLEVVPESPARTSLETLARFVLERDL